MDFTIRNLPAPVLQTPYDVGTTPAGSPRLVGSSRHGYHSCMANPDPISDILKLSLAERIQAVADIWDSIAAEPDALELTPGDREKLDRRLADQEANPGVGRSWSEVKARLLGSG